MKSEGEIVLNGAAPAADDAEEIDPAAPLPLPAPELELDDAATHAAFEFAPYEIGCDVADSVRGGCGSARCATDDEAGRW